MNSRAKLFILSVSFIIPAILFTNYVLNQYYSHGSGLLDVGWFTYLLTNATSWPLKNPEIIAGTFFQTHFSLFFYITSIVYSYILFFIPEPVYFSIFIGSMYGVISLSLCMIGLQLTTQFTVRNSLILLFISVTSSMNGAALSLIGFPHIEIAIPALLLLFLSLYFTNRKILSYIVFTLLLSIREDAGLHAFSLLITILLTHYVLTRSLKELDLNMFFLAIAGGLYTVIAMHIQNTYFPGDNALERVYLGNPHFSHITSSFLADRLEYFLHERAYIYVPVLFSIIFSFYTKNIFLLSSLIASAPWFLLSLIAISTMPGTFSNYYAFPFIITAVWPAFSFLIANKIMSEQLTNTKGMALSIIFITGLSLLLFPSNRGNVDSKPWEHFIFSDYKAISSTEEFINFFNLNKKSYGNVLFDEPTAALFSKNLHSGEYGYLNNFSKAVKAKADTVMFYTPQSALNGSSSHIMKPIILENNLNKIFKIRDTNIIIATNRLIKSDLFIPFDELFSNSYFASELPSQIGELKNHNRVAIKAIDNAGFLTYGPYIQLEGGKYEFTLTYSSQSSSSQVIGSWDVGLELSTETNILKKGVIYGTDNTESEIRKTFTIIKKNAGKRVEIRSFYNGTGHLMVKKLGITRIDK